jgi:uncharacterized protein (TIGR03435 family)
MKILRTIALSHLITAYAIAQNEFEAASVRPVATTEQRVDIGMHIDGSLVRFNYLSLLACMRIAYEMKPYQFIGPEWIVTDHFNIMAKLPAGASQDQVRAMLQNLLLDRFRMTVHREKRDFPVYAMTLGKGGLKLKETAPDEAAPDAGAPKSSLDVKATGSAAGVFADLGNGAYFTFADNQLIGQKLPMWRVADLLSNFMDKPVIDMTGLSSTTNYDLSLEITADDYRTMQIRAALKSGINLPPEAPQMADLPTDSLTAAIEAAGMRLESRKAPQDVIVIDHADKTPTEN